MNTMYCPKCGGDAKITMADSGSFMIKCVCGFSEEGTIVLDTLKTLAEGCTFNGEEEFMHQWLGTN